jgi:hypothetical protein
MPIEAALVAYIKTVAEITSLIGTGGACRIYPLKLPQNPDYPAVTYQVISSPRHHDIEVAYPRIQYTSFARTYGQTKELADLIRLHLQRLKGVLSGASIKQIEYINSVEFYQDDTQIYYIPQDFKIIYEGE